MVEKNTNNKVQRKRKHYTIKDSYEIMMKKVDNECNRIMYQVSYLIRQERIHNNISLRDVSNLTKVSIKTITDLEECKSLPKIETLLKLAYVLDIAIVPSITALREPLKENTNMTPQEQSMEIISKELSRLFNKKAKEDILKYIDFIRTTSK